LKQTLENQTINLTDNYQEIRNSLIDWGGESLSFAAHFVIGEKLLLTFSDPKASKVLDMDPDFFKQYPIHLQDYLPDNELFYIREAVLKGYGLRSSYEIPFRFINKKGNIKWIVLKGFFANLDQDVSSGELHSCGFFIDANSVISNIQEYEKQALFYESTLNKMPIELVMLNPDQRYIFVSQAAIKNEEVRKWIIGKTDQEYAEYRQKDPTIVRERLAYFHQAIDTKKEVEWEEVMNNTDGEASYALRRYSPILDQDNQVKIVLGYGFNISALKTAQQKIKENEQLLLSLNANLEEGIYRFKKGIGFLYINKAFAEVFGYENPDLILGNTGNFFTQDIVARSELIKFIGDDGVFKNREVLFKRQNGEEFWGMVSCIKSLDELGNVFYDGVLVDINDIKQTQQLLLKKNQELVQTNRELDHFVYSASHDLRAPVTTIQGILQIADMDVTLSFQSKEYLDLIKKSTDKLDAFIRDLIDYNKNSRADLQIEKLNPQQIINESIGLVQNIQGFELSDIRVEITGSEVVFSDANRIQLILKNLLSNSIKFKNLKQNPLIYITFNCVDNGFEIRLSDNGKGIPANHIEKVFDLFYRADKNHSGSGLGLYIVRETVRKLHGTVKIESVNGQGTIFTMFFPSLLS